MDISHTATERWSRARLARDARFDGMFVVAVKSTGIYCRPVCPAPLARESNVRYFTQAAAAAAAGFRPCLRCRPERAPGLRSYGEQAFDLALKRVGEGFLAEHSVAELAERVGVSDRHLRRQFEQQMGIGPLALHANQRLLLAKQLLAETRLPVTEVALAAGFASLRRFNQAFHDACGMPPTALRKQSEQISTAPERIELLLGYRPPFDFTAHLEFLAARALPGLEWVEGGCWRRQLGAAAQLDVVDVPERCAIRVSLQGVKAARIPDLLRRVRRVFDVNADPACIAEQLGSDPILQRLLQVQPGLRLPGMFDGFEGAVRAILGQQISVAAARTLAIRLMTRCAEQFADAEGFPRPAELAELDFDGLGLTSQRVNSLRSLGRAVAEGSLDLEAPQPLSDWLAQCQQVPGIGPWTAAYMGMRVLHHPDAFPGGDLVVRKAMARALSASAMLPNERRVRQHAEAWRPWRAYAVIQLWRAQSESASANKPSVKSKGGQP
ncbi:DNA-3-methyladenine glycosylase 2 family protein [Pseudomarimonas arenosa]|uniref:DNA-3-methyladenine glycosylase II n=1 Tax=Pseudomarimonas arenosa TaxID=2774145 RepID=A0AAW3ZKV2_9GAMM|nr:DNA-3-methyladenine glycosylase 2 [Pseudomarimonas arenosa]MBD8526070.1 DNA-3-methyladenine glycosylase 2 family protein [Pseudomarimonas arenosa]